MPPGIRAPSRSSFVSSLAFRDRVHIDADRDLVGYVTAFMWTQSRNTVEVSWLHNGTSQSAWFDHWRLTPVES